MMLIIQIERRSTMEMNGTLALVTAANRGFDQATAATAGSPTEG